MSFFARIGMSERASSLYRPAERGKAKDSSSFNTAEETAVLNEVEKIIAELGDSSVKVKMTESEKLGTGMELTVRGFMSTGIQGTGDFHISTKDIKRMAADKDYKKQVLAEIKSMVSTEKQNKAETAKLLSSKSFEIPPFYKDFWNEDRTKPVFGSFNGHVQQALISKYEAFFTYV